MESATKFKGSHLHMAAREKTRTIEQGVCSAAAASNQFQLLFARFRNRFWTFWELDALQLLSINRARLRFETSIETKRCAACETARHPHEKGSKTLLTLYDDDGYVKFIIESLFMLGAVLVHTFPVRNFNFLRLQTNDPRTEMGKRFVRSATLFGQTVWAEANVKYFSVSSATGENHPKLLFSTGYCDAMRRWIADGWSISSLPVHLCKLVA